MKETYRSNGKLLLTGEYLVLKEALALALPLKFGQTMDVDTNSTSTIQWASHDDQSRTWFEGMFDIEGRPLKSTDKTTADRLAQLIGLASENTPKTKSLGGAKIETHLEFNRAWGWGSSSTLIDLIAQWYQVDPFHLANESFGGSGYDIACARSQSPIIYQLIDGKPHFEAVDFNPRFKSKLYFIYTGQKQDTRKALSKFNQTKDYYQEVKELNQLTTALNGNMDYQDFIEVIRTHEKILSSVLHQDSISESIFKDFEGVVKSLGGWGGDFILACHDSEEYVRTYFEGQHYLPIFNYDEIVLQ